MNLTKNVALISGALALSVAGAAFAAGEHEQHIAAAPAADAASAMAMTAGEVRKVDVEQRKVTIKHEAITNLDMPAMTMVFRVSKPEQLKDLKAGDKVRFHAESDAGALLVTHLEAVR